MTSLQRSTSYIRLDQFEWLEQEAARRVEHYAGIQGGRGGKHSEIIREALDMLMEYQRHCEWLHPKLRGKQHSRATRVSKQKMATAAERAAEYDADNPDRPPVDPVNVRDTATSKSNRLDMLTVPQSVIDRLRLAMESTGKSVNELVERGLEHYL